MLPYDLTEVEDIFAAVLETPEADRLALVDRRCAERPRIREEVVALLAAHAIAPDIVPSALTGRPMRPSLGAVPALEPGRVIAHYRIDAYLGAGGMGQVYRAWDVALDRPAAIKVLAPGVTDELTSRLIREVEAAAHLQHPAIATFFEGGKADGSVYFAMELVEGGSLRRRLDQGPVGPDEAFRIATALLGALAHAHASGILHRDIKPENIMIGQDGRPKLLDFGLARHFIVEDADDMAAGAAMPLHFTTSGSTPGTPGYMSPEQLRGDPLGPPSDLFQVAAVWYEMITGRRAFGGPSLLERIAATLATPPDVPAIPAEQSERHSGLAASIARALALRPSDRYASASDWLVALGELAEAGIGGADAGAHAAACCARAQELWRESGRDVRIVPLLRQAISLAPDHVPAHAALVPALAMRFIVTGERRDLEEIVVASERALALAPENAPAWTWRGYALHRLERHAEAEAALLRAEASDPRDPFPSYSRAALRLDLRLPGEAVVLFRQALALEPRFGMGWLGLGWALHSLQQYSEARESLQRARALEGLPRPSLVAGVGGYLAETLRCQGRLDDAWAAARTGLVSIEKSDHVYRDMFRALCLGSLGRVALAQQNGPAARAAFSQAIAQMRGRSRTQGGGHMMVQALAGLSQCTGDPAPFDEALALFTTRRGYSFRFFFACEDWFTIGMLADAAELHRPELVTSLRAPATGGDALTNR